MSGRDPIDDWLGTDVDLLPPRPGTFERIHRQARRRKTTTALSAAAGVAVLIAAAATVPQLLPNQGGGPNKVYASPTRTPPPSRHASTSPAPHRTPATSKPTSTRLAGANLATPNVSRRATAGIAPSSVTFVNGSVGAVIGETTSSCPRGCEAVAGTTDYGQTWFGVNPPPAGPANGDSGVSQIRFLEQRNGWAFGPALYVTHDGGATWVRVTGLPGRVIDLATIGGSAYAVVARCTGTGASYAEGCTSFQLYTSPYYANSFQRVPGAGGQAAVTPGGLQLTHPTGYLLAEHHLFTGSPNGGAWQAISAITGLVPACLDGNGHQAASSEHGLIAPGASGILYLLCQGGRAPVLYESTDSGQTWQRDGQINTPGTATSMAVAPFTGAIVVATNAAIVYSANGHRWSRATLSGPAPTGGFSFVGMTTANGVALAAGPQSKLVYITNDGGQTWHATRV